MFKPKSILVYVLGDCFSKIKGFRFNGVQRFSIGGVGGNPWPTDCTAVDKDTKVEYLYNSLVLFISPT